MKYKTYRVYKIFIVILMTLAIAALVSSGNYILSLIIFAAAIILEILLRKRVNIPLSDERLDKIAGKASRIVMVSFALLMAAVGIVFISLREISIYYVIIGNTLIGIECSMMLLYAILFKYYSRKT